MNWTKLLARLIAVAIALWAVGAAYTLGLRTLTGDYVVAAVAVLALVAVALVVAVRVGARDAEWRSNPESYW